MRVRLARTPSVLCCGTAARARVAVEHGRPSRLSRPAVRHARRRLRQRDAAEVEHAVRAIGLDAVQLHGDETVDAYRHVAPR